MLFNNIYNLETYNDESVILNSVAKKGYTLLDEIVPDSISTNVFVQTLMYRYGILSGANAGYGFFSPNVPSDVDVYFDLVDFNSNEGTTEVILNTEFGKKRFVSTLSSFRAKEDLKPLLARSWAARVLSQFPTCRSITVRVGSIYVPPMEDYITGKDIEFMQTSSFTFDLSI